MELAGCRHVIRNRTSVWREAWDSTVMGMALELGDKASSQLKPLSSLDLSVLAALLRS